MFSIVILISLNNHHKLEIVQKKASNLINNEIKFAIFIIVHKKQIEKCFESVIIPNKRSEL